MSFLVRTCGLMTPKAPKTVSLQGSSWSTQLALLPRRWEFWLLLGAIPLAIFGVWWLRVPFATMLAHIGDLRAWILTFGPLAPLAYIGIFSLQIIIAPIPGQ